MARDTQLDDVMDRRRRKKRSRIAGFEISDVGDLVTSATSEAGDIATSAISDVPGAQAVFNAANDVLTGPVRDFANSPVGSFILRAAASTVYGGLAPVLGPQLAAVAFAIPGAAAGEDFLTAWTQEFGRRVQETAQIMGADYAAPYLKDQLEKATAYFGQLTAQGIDPLATKLQDFANAAGVSDWAAAFVRDKARGAMHDLLNYFSPVTGQLLSTASLNLATATSQLTAADLAARARIATATPQTSVSQFTLTRQGAIPTFGPAPTAPLPVAEAAPGAPQISAQGKTVVYLSLGFLLLSGGLFFWKTRG